MVKFKFVFSSSSDIISKKGVIEQDGFNSFKLVPVSSSSTFQEKFDEAFEIKNRDVVQSLNTLNNEANNIKSEVFALSTNLEENYLSEAKLYEEQSLIELASAIKESTATFVTTEQAGQWYGLELITDVNGKKYVTGFDTGAIVYPETGNSNSYFRINADRFIVGGDLGDGSFSSMLGPDGEPIPAFSIVQDGSGPAEMYFNGKVSINSVPTAFNKLIGKFASKLLLDVYLAENPDVIVNEGDTYHNTTENVMYFWDGDEWISAESKLELRSYVFKRSKNKPATPTGGSYSNPIPAGWDDGIPAPTFSTGTSWSNFAVDPVWVSYALFDNKTDYTVNQVTWTEPEIMADTPTSDVMFNNSLTTPVTPQYTGDMLEVQAVDSANGWYNIAAPNAVWTAHRRKNAGVWTPWYVYKVKGEAGTPGATGATGSRGSAILSGTETTPSGFTSAFNSTFGSALNGDQYVSTSNTAGTKIYTYTGGSWVNNTALTVHGDAVVNGTLAASKLVTNYLQSSSIYINDTNPSQSTPIGASNAYFYTANKWAALVGVNAAGSGAGVGGKGFWGVHAVSETIGGRGLVAWATAISGVGVWGEGKQTGVVGISTSAATTTSTGIYTPNKCQADNGFVPFTGSHIVFTLDEGINEGDIVSTEFGFLMEVNQAYAEVGLTKEAVDKRVLGVSSSSLLDDVLEFTSTDRFLNNVELVDGKEVYTIKEQYNNFFETSFSKLPYKRLYVNSLGEGGINVCEVGGDLEIGDYICSSDVKGKGMKQDDDLLHNYTVAKALENVVWDSEIVGKNGCFEFEGVKCKMIACTYHCG